MITVVTIEPMSLSEFSENPQKPYSVSYLTSIPLEIPSQDAWEIIKEVIRVAFPDETPRTLELETVTKDFASGRYCFSVHGKIEPEALDVTIDV